MYAATRFLLFASFAAACASGGSGAPGDDQPKMDAPQGTPIDAPASTIDGPTTPVDAPMTPLDAFVPQDAPGLFCSANNQCTVGGECCLTVGQPQGFCVPGTIILGECFPI
jgi:hypothetical protein